MIFERPAACLLLFAAPLVAWFLWRARAYFDSRAHRAVVIATGTLAVVALAVALAGPFVRSERGRPTRVVVASGNVTEIAAAWRRATSTRDPFHVVAPGDPIGVSPRGTTAPPTVTGDPDLGAALSTACTLAPDGGDIAFVGPAGDSGAELTAWNVERLAAQLRSCGLRIHLRDGALPRADVALLGVEHACRVDVGEAFRVTARIHATTDALARIEVRARADDLLLGMREQALRAGTTAITIDVGPGGRRGIVELETRVAVDGRPTSVEHSAILCEGTITATWLGATDLQFDALRTTLAPHGIELSRGDLAAADAGTSELTDVVIVDDLPATAWSVDAQRTLADLIPTRGVGLLLAGAWRNLGPGGYANSPLASLLPVEMPQREERRDPSCALVVVIDTSGSMGSRIDLAKEVARLAIRRLMPHDKAGIVEFYGSKRWAAPLQPASNLIELMRALDRMQAGGGTVIYSALEESYYALLNARTRFKHILVLTDGGVESGPFEDLARRIADANMQLSTVLIGPQAQSEFLMNLAQWGGGRFYACPSRFQLPDLRFKEPQTTRLPTVREERITATATAGRETTAEFQGDGEIALGGVVEAMARPQAEPLVMADGGASVLAAWDQGVGRVATLATELLGPLSDPVRGPRWSNFLADQIRSLARGREATRPRLSITTSRRAATVTLAGDTAVAERTLKVVSGTGMQEFVLRPDRDGNLGTTIAWSDAAPLRFEVVGVRASGAAMRPLPRDGRLDDRSRELSALATATGGTTDGPLPTEPPPPVQSGRISLMPHFAFVGLLAFLALVLARRWPRSAPRAALGLLAFVLLQPALRAQDEAAVASRIGAQLRDVGDLDPLVEEWRDGTHDQKVALAIARGDLDRVIELTTDAKDLPTRIRRALALDARGRLDEAVALLATIADDPTADPQVAAGAVLHRAELLLAGGKTAEAATAFRAAASAGSPAMRRAIGHLAGGMGLVDVALELHTVDDSMTASARNCAHLRRGAWFEASGNPSAARAEYRAAAESAPLDRDRAFALSRELGLAKDLPAQQAFAASIRADLSHASTVELEALIDALRAIGDGDGVLALLDDANVASHPGIEEEIVAAAVECGRAERAIGELSRRLESAPHDFRLRISLALLLTDLQRKDAAREVLLTGIGIGSHREVLALTQAAGELFEDAARDAGVAHLRASASESERFDGILLQVELLRARHKAAEAAQVALDARGDAHEQSSRARLASVLESLGRNEESIALLRALHEEKPSEDVALRLAWLLSQGRTEAERTESQKLFREVWLGAGSLARRTQAQERVLDAAARDGTLADLAIELENSLAEPQAQNRDARREALVKIWTRAQDTFGARDVLLQWATEQPEHEIDAWQAIAQVCLETDDYRGQERALRHLMEVDTENALEYRQQLVLAFLERGRAGEARAVIRELLAKESSEGAETDAVTFEFSAGIFALAGKPKEAARLYRRAYAVHPDRIETLLLWANATQSQGRGGEAIGLFLDLVTQDVPDDLFLVAVDGLLNLTAPTEALRFTERALRRRIAANPDRVFLQRALQDVLEQLGDKAGRLAVLEATILIAGQQRSAWLREAMDEASQTKDWTRYLEHARSLLRTGDEVPPAVFVEMGEALLAAQDLSGAERAFARARLAPDFASIERNIATAYESARRFEDAERILRRALRRAPDDPEAMFAVARLCEQRGSRPEALELWSRGATALIRGEVFASSSGPRLVINRNRRSEGPDVDQAIDGTLRTADSLDDAAPVRDAVLARLDSRESLDTAARRTLATRLRAFGDAFGDSVAATRARAIEDDLLREDKLDARMRRELIGDAIRRLEIERLTALPEKAFDGLATERVRALLLAGKDEEAARRLDELDPLMLDAPLRWLSAIGETAMRDKAIVRLRDLASTDPLKAGRAWVRAAPLIGEVGDEQALLDAELAAAAAATGNAKVRVSRLLAALRADRKLDPEVRATHARKLVDLAVEARDGNLASSILEAAKDWLPAAELAPLVPLSLEKLSSPYLAQTRFRQLHLLSLDDAEQVVRKFLSATGEEGRMPVLQSIGSGAIESKLAIRLIDLLGKNQVASASSYWLTQLSTSERLDKDLASAVARQMLRVAPDDPRRLLLELRATDDPKERSDTLSELCKSLRAAPTVDTSWIGLMSAVMHETNGAERQTLLATVPAGTDSAPDALLRSALEATQGHAGAAADEATAAAAAAPDNLAVQNHATTLLGLLGRTESIARIYKAWLLRATEIYPFQATQLAEALLQQGDALGAIEALDRAKDDYDYTSATRMRAALMLDDPKIRARELAKWSQSQRRARSGTMIILRSFSGAASPSTQRVDFADAIADPGWPRFDVENSSATSSAIERLGSVPEGPRILGDLVRKMDPSARLSASEQYRGLLVGARRFGDLDATVTAALRRFESDSADADARCLLWAAVQLGIVARGQAGDPSYAVPAELVDRLFRDRILLADQNRGELVELCWTALQLGREAEVDRILNTILVDRAAATAIPDDPTSLGPLLTLAAQRAPELLARLDPIDTIDVELDAWLFTIALESQADVDSLRSRFALLDERMHGVEGRYQTLRIALPWCGLELRSGDVDAALRTLAVDDQTIRRGDSFAARSIAAAVPPLDRWRDPSLAATFGERLVELAAGEPEFARRFLFLRVCGLLTHRLDAAGRRDEATALRARLAPLIDGIPAAAAWVTAGA